MLIHAPIKSIGHICLDFKVGGGAFNASSKKPLQSIPLFINISGHIFKLTATEYDDRTFTAWGMYEPEPDFQYDDYMLRATEVYETTSDWGEARRVADVEFTERFFHDMDLAEQAKYSSWAAENAQAETAQRNGTIGGVV